eukprot:410248_1
MLSTTTTSEPYITKITPSLGLYLIQESPLVDVIFWYSNIPGYDAALSFICGFIEILLSMISFFVGSCFAFDVSDRVTWVAKAFTQTTIAITINLVLSSATVKALRCARKRDPLTQKVKRCLFCRRMFAYLMFFMYLPPTVVLWLCGYQLSGYQNGLYSFTLWRDWLIFLMLDIPAVCGVHALIYYLCKNHCNRNKNTTNFKQFKEIATRNYQIQNLLHAQINNARTDLDPTSKNTAQLGELTEFKTKYNDLETRYNDSQTQNKDVYTKYNDLEAQLGASKTKYNDLETQYKDYQAKYNDVETQYKDCQAKYNDLVAEYAESNTKYGDLETKYKELKGQYNALEAEYGESQTKYKDLDTTCNDLQTQYNDAQTQITQYNDLKTKYSDLEAKCNGFEAQYNASLTKISDFEAQYNDLETKYNDLTAEHNDVQTEYNQQITINESLKANTEQTNEKIEANEALQSKILALEEENKQLQQTSEALANQLADAEDETNEQVVALQTAQTNLQNQFTTLLQQKTDLKQENEQWMDKYNALSETHEKVTELNTDATERNVTAAAQIEELNETISKLQVQIQNTLSTEKDTEQVDVLQSKIEELSQQIQNKNKQISEQRSKGEEMLNQREALQRRLSESQANILQLQRKCQDLESELTDKGNTIEHCPTAAPGKEEDGITTEGTVTRDDVLSFCNINDQLKPVDELITQFVSEWQHSSQVFMLDEEDEIKENEGRQERCKEWTSLESVLENVTNEINEMKENITQPQVYGLVMDLITQKILLSKHLGTVHMTKGQQMSQIMFEAQKRIVSLQSDLVKKNREMEIHLKVKQKMYEEIKSVQQKVENLTREYQTIVSELDHVRQRRKDSVDSSFS